MIDNIQENYIQKEVKFSTSFCIAIWIVSIALSWSAAFGIIYAIKIAIGAE